MCNIAQLLEGVAGIAVLPKHSGRSATIQAFDELQALCGLTVKNTDTSFDLRQREIECDLDRCLMALFERADMCPCTLPSELKRKRY